MARADLLKKLFSGYKSNDRELFMKAARDLIEDERKKSHVLLANDLHRILENGKPMPVDEMPTLLEPVPRDAGKSIALFEVQWPDRHLRELVLSDHQLEIMKSVLDQFRQWDVLHAYGLTPPHKLLFCGPPGCGKTITAEAIATELGLPLLYVRFDAVVSSLLGETAANLRKVFDYSSRGSWVLLFDEFDAIGRSRDDLTEHGELKRVVNSFLQLLDHFHYPSLVIAATNFEQSLDPALWRRFDEIVRFDRPTRRQIEQLLKLHFSQQIRASFALPTVAAQLDGMTQAEIERICLDVIREAVIEGARTVSRRDMDKAVHKQRTRLQMLAAIKKPGAPSVDSE